MRIATLQIAPKLGDVEGNIRRANELLKSGKGVSIGEQDLGIGIGVEILKPELLVLPEMALTGTFESCMDGMATGFICARLTSCHIPYILTGFPRVQFPLIRSSQALP